MIIFHRACILTKIKGNEILSCRLLGNGWVFTLHVTGAFLRLFIQIKSVLVDSNSYGSRLTVPTGDQ